MTFTSLTWLAAMAATIGFYWLLPSRWRNAFLAIASLAFLASIDWLSALYLLIFTGASYWMSSGERLSKRSIAVAIAAVVLVIGYYKLQVSNSPVDVLRDVAMPIGMSYYAFRVVHYLIEKYRGTLPEHKFYDYVCYLFFMPTLLVGPIHRFRQFQTDHESIKWSAANLSEGMERILIGYFKIVVIGNYLFSTYFAGLIGSIDPEQQSLILYLEAVRGSLNLYFQFSGYSDVAIGFALMLGYRVMENFNNPFLKTNIAEFWRCWHISLTSWSRDYVYMTVVGLTRNPYIGTLTSLLVIGIWHELSLRYIVWGLYHGIGIIVVNRLQKFWRQRDKKRGVRRTREPDGLLLRSGKIFLTANYFFFGYIIINQESLLDTLRVYQIILFGWL